MCIRDSKLLYGNGVTAEFGSGGSDGLLQIKANASGGSSITENGGGDLTIQSTGTGIIFQKAGTSEILAKMKTDAEVELYHNANQKFETTSTGINVTGNVVGDGLTIDQTTSTIRGRDFNRAIQAQLTPLILALR